MSLESLFQHIIFSEHQAEESRRLMREGQGLCCLSWGLGAGGKAGGSGQGSEGSGKDSRKVSYHRPQNRDSREMDVFKHLIFITVRSEINRCREKIKKAAEQLNKEKIQLESKVLTCRTCSLSLEKVFLFDFLRI